MKYLLLVFIFATQALAHEDCSGLLGPLDQSPGLSPTKVVPYDSNKCMPAVGQQFRVFTKGKVTKKTIGSDRIYDVDEAMAFITDYLSGLEHSFAKAGDVQSLKNLRPLCTGLFDDGEHPNALAIGQDNILIGLELIYKLQSAWMVDGKIGLQMVLAHEFAHLIQNRMELEFNMGLPLFSTKKKELQADCIAGALITLHNHDPKNLPEAKKLTQFVADHHVIGDHGTQHERMRAIDFGMTQAVRMRLLRRTKDSVTSGDIVNACSHFYPAMR